MTLNGFMNVIIATYKMDKLLVCAKLLVSIFTFHTCCIRFNASDAQITAHGSRRAYMNDRIMSKRLLWRVEQPNTYLCLAECARDASCCSIFYNKATTKCQGHSITFGSTDESSNDPHTLYYVRPHGQQYVGDECVTGDDCVTVNSECRGGLCLCVPGYSFSPRTHKCLAGCSEYGSDFLAVRDYFISHTNKDVFLAVTLADCFALCLNRTEYACISLEHGRSDGKCYLADITKLDWPGRWFADSNGLFNISYYQRDCA